MMEVHLGVVTCDKCGEPMEKGHPVLIIADGVIVESNCVLTFEGANVRYACHLGCGDCVEEAE